MSHAELAALLVEASDAEREALLRENSALADVQLAYLLKNTCLDGWSTHPSQALAAADSLTLLRQSNDNDEIAALCAWTAGLRALINDKLEDAIDALDESESRFLKLNNAHAAAATQVSKVIALSILGRYEEAIECGLQAREVFLAHGDLAAAGKIEHNIGNLYFRRDNYHKAEVFQTAARERFVSLDDKRQLATVNNCLANTHALLHKFESAEQLYKEAVKQADESGQPVTLAGIEGNIGNFALLQGRYDQALDYLERSRRDYASLGMPTQSLLAEHEIADAYLELNLAPESLAIYDRVIPEFVALGMRAEEARAKAYRGRALVLLNRFSEAQEALEDARKVYLAEGNEVGAAIVELTQAQLHYKTGKYSAASTLATQAAETLAASGGWQRILLARWLRGEAERAEGNTEAAEPILLKSLEESSQQAQPQIAERCYTSLGLLTASREEMRTAEKYFRKAIALTEELRAPLPSEEFRTSFFSDRLVPYEQMVKLCLSDGTDRVAEALAFVESGRSRALADALSGTVRITTEARDEFEADLMRQMEALLDELNYLYNRLNSPVRGESPHHSESQELQQEVAKREGKLQEITRQLQHRNEKVTGQSSSLSVAHLQSQLGTETALVEYSTLDGELMAFVVTNETVKVFRELAYESDVRTEVEKFRFQIDTLRFGSAQVRQHLPVLTKRVRKHLNSLYDQLLRPIESMIGNRRLVIVPDRVLHYLPFQALHDGQTYLIERREVSYAPSAIVLQQCLNRPSVKFETALLMGVADELIPRVRHEIEAIGKKFPSAVSFFDSNARIDAMREHASVDVLHLACHAHFRPDNPLFSSLRLGDGWLTVRDAYGLRLNSGLVTLSACETGMNAVAPGNELIGLARGFFAAGSASVVLSLWTIDDEATSDLMVEFYTQLRASGSPSAALRLAQVKALNANPHPFFWSPFVLAGRW
jgi:CHAT domain-containing protein